MYKIIQYGVGYIGKRAIRLALRKGMEIVAALDTDPSKIGKDVGEVVGLEKLDVKVSATADVQRVAHEVEADAVLNATVTYLKPVWEQIRPFVESKMNALSIAEELAYPWMKYPELSREIDKTAKKHGVTVVGTGVNPGLAMDYGPLSYSGGCWKIDKIKIKRVVDMGVYSPTRGTRRFAIPAGRFREGVMKKEIPLHTGFNESMDMIANTLGWKVDETIETWEPMISKSRRETPWYTVEPGQVCGWRQLRVGSVKGEAKVILELYMIVRPKLEEDGVEAGDTTEIDGEPSIFVTDRGGTTLRGELVTTARLVNLVPYVIGAKPGLLSIKDFPPAPPLPDVRYILPPPPK